jgi:hypothetical protein
VLQGVELTFYRGRGSVGQVATGSNGRSNGLNSIDGLGGLRMGLKQGFKVGKS